MVLPGVGFRCKHNLKANSKVEDRDLNLQRAGYYEYERVNFITSEPP